LSSYTGLRSISRTTAAEIAVRTNGGVHLRVEFATQLTSAPYAITARNLGGTLPASQLSGTLPSAAVGTYSGAVTLGNTGNTSRRWHRATNVNAAALAGFQRRTSGKSPATAAPHPACISSHERQSAAGNKVNNTRALQSSRTPTAPNVMAERRQPG